MSDTKESMPGVQPPEKPTRRMEPPPDWAIALKEQMENGFRGLRADVSMVANDVGLLRDRVVVLERHKVEADDRAAKHSGGLVRGSETDAKHESNFAQVFTRLDGVEGTLKTIAEKPDTSALVIAEVKNLAKTPMGQKIVGGIATLALLAMALLTATLKAKVDAIEAKPATVQPAPTVYLTAPTDGGAR